MKNKLFMLNKIIVRGALKVLYITQNKSNDCISFERWFQSYTDSTRAAYSPICGRRSDSNRCSTIQNNISKKDPLSTNPVCRTREQQLALRTICERYRLKGCYTLTLLCVVYRNDPSFHAAFTLIWMLSDYASPHRFITHYTVKKFQLFFHQSHTAHRAVIHTIYFAKKRITVHYLRI